MTQAGEHNPYNPSPVYCISPPTCTLSLSLSLSLSGTQREKKKKSRFLPTKVGHRRFASGDVAASLLERRKEVLFSLERLKTKAQARKRFSTPDTDSQPQRSWSGRTQPPPTTASAPEQHDGPCRGCHPNLEAPNQRCPGCNHLQRSRTGSARCAASCCTSPWYLHAATPFAFGALTGVCLTLAYRSVHCVDRNSRTCLASANCCTTC